MSFDGDISQIGQLADRVADLSTVPSRAARGVAFELDGFLQDEFVEGEDPYGVAWEELADATVERGRTPPPLTDSGDMRATAHVRPGAGAGIVMTVTARYAPPHQTGWHGPQGDGPARPMLPDREELPDAWQDAIERHVERAVRR